MVFERAYDTCPLCVPARTALATGVYPTKNGVVYNDWKGVTEEALNRFIRHYRKQDMKLAISEWIISA